MVNRVSTFLGGIGADMTGFWQRVANTLQISGNLTSNALTVSESLSANAINATSNLTVNSKLVLYDGIDLGGL